MPKYFGKFLVFVLGGVVVASSQAATTAAMDNARAKGLAWLVLNQKGDGGWWKVDGQQVYATSEVLEALRKSGVKGYLKAKAVATLGNSTSITTDGVARIVSGLAMAGVDVSKTVILLKSMRNKQFTNPVTPVAWGSYSNGGSTNLDTAIAIYSLNQASVAASDYSKAYDFLCKGTNVDGGWTAVTMPSAAATSEVFATAQAVRGLFHVRSQPCGSTTVQAKIDGGISWLKSQQKTGGSFGEGTDGTILETAAVVGALMLAAPASVSEIDKARDWLIGQQSSDGDWQKDPLLTAIALQSLPDTVLVDTDGDGLPDVVETVLGTDRLIANVLNTVSNGNAKVGLNVPLVLAAEAVLNQAFNYTLSANGGVAPYTWRIVSGVLPTGLTLNGTTGVISGTPTALGVYTFSYEARDANGATATTAGQIGVYRSKPSLATGDVDGDGKVNLKDLLLLERAVDGFATLTADQIARADVSPAGEPDGVLDVADVARLRLKVLEFEDF